MKVLLLSQIDWRNGTCEKLFDGQIVEVKLDTIGNASEFKTFIEYYENRIDPPRWIDKIKMMWRFTDVGMLMHYANEAGYRRILLEQDGSISLRFLLEET